MKRWTIQSELALAAALAAEERGDREQAELLFLRAVKEEPQRTDGPTN